MLPARALPPQTSTSSFVARFDANAVCWGPYRTLREAVRDDPALVTGNPVFAEVRHPSGYAYPTPGFAASFVESVREASGRAPRFGEHTDEVLSRVLRLPDSEIARLHDQGTVAGA